MIAVVEVYSTVSWTVFSDLLCALVYFIFSLKLLGRLRRWPLPLIPPPNLPLKRLSTLSLKRDPGILALVSWDVKYLIVWNAWLYIIKCCWLTNWVGGWAAELRPQAKMLPGLPRLLEKIVQVILVSRLVWVYVILSFFDREIKNHVYCKQQTSNHTTWPSFPSFYQQSLSFCQLSLGTLEKDSRIE